MCSSFSTALPKRSKKAWRYASYSRFAHSPRRFFWPGRLSSCSSASLRRYWPAHLFFLLAPTLCFAIASLAAFSALGLQLFQASLQASRPLKAFTDISCIIYALSAVWFFKALPLYIPWVFLTHPTRLDSIFIWTALGLIAVFAVILVGRLARRPIIAFGGLAATEGILIFFVAVLQRPYLAYPFVTATGAFTALATAKILFIAFSIGIIAVVLALALLYRLFRLYKIINAMRPARMQ